MPIVSPSTPSRRRRSSSIASHLSLASASPQSNASFTKRPANSRRSSQCSVASPSTPRPISSHDGSGYFESSKLFDELVDPVNANGLGNLADELAEVFDEDDEGGHELRDGALETQYDRAESIRHDTFKENEHPISKIGSQRGQDTFTSPARQTTTDLSLSPRKQSPRSRYRGEDLQYDGSDYGRDSEVEDTQSPSLEARLAAVERLTHQGTEANSSEADEIVQRVADSLRDLGSQAGVENSAAR